MKNRLVGAIVVKGGISVQSFSYKSYLPIGQPKYLVENLERWGADEIILQCIDRHDCGPDFALLSRVAELGLSTPLIYGGGIRTVDDGIEVIRHGADRVIVDSLVHDCHATIRQLSDQLGTQALIASLPVCIENRKLKWIDYRSRSSEELPASLIKLLESNVFSEVVIVDYEHEGYPMSFDSDLINYFPVKDIQIIAFGGISCSRQVATLMSFENVGAVAVGNQLLYREHAFQLVSGVDSSLDLRERTYSSDGLSILNA